jgi:phospholipid/cholesterol/gamma-HCH transport system substrate-binding protein
MKNTLETRLGIFFAVAVIAAAFLVELAGGLDYFKRGFRLRARFATVQELKKGDPVKVAGVQVGTVEAIDFVADRVEVAMKLKSRTAVKTDSVASIRFSGLLGQNFVSITFGTAAGSPVEDDALIASVEQPDLSSLLTKLDNVASGVEGLAKNFGGDSLDKLFGPFIDFMKQNNSKLGSILGNMQTVSSQIADGKGTIGKLIADDALYTSVYSAVTNMSGISEDLKGLVTDAKAAVADARSTIGDINAGKGTIGLLAKDEALYRQSTEAMVNLKEILQKVNQGQGLAGKLVNDESFYKNVRLTLQKVETATESIEDQGPISVINFLTRPLF